MSKKSKQNQYGKESHDKEPQDKVKLKRTKPVKHYDLYDEDDDEQHYENLAKQVMR